jgi:signal transduction histidine kinase
VFLVLFAVAALPMVGWPSAANAASRPGGAVALGQSFSHDYGPIAAPEGRTVYDEDYFSPTDCYTALAASCDVIPLDLDLPRTSPSIDVVFSTTLQWDASNGSRLFFEIFAKRTNEDGSVYYNDLRKGQTGASPSHLELVNPDDSQLFLRVASIDGRNTGYSLRATLTQVPFELPVDYSAFPGGGPAPAATGTALPAGAAALTQPGGLGDGAAGPLFAAGAPLAVHIRDATPAPRDASSGGRPWLLALLGVLSLAVGVGAVARQVDSLEEPRAGALGAAQGRLGDIRLFWKLLLPFLTIILAGGVVAAFLTTRYLTARASSQLDDDLVQRSVSALSYVRDREAALLDAQRFAANIEGLPEAVAAKDTAKAASAMASALAVNTDLDLLAATDATGTGVVEFTRTGDTFAQSRGASFAGAVAGALTGSSAVPAVVDVNGNVLLTTAGAVRNPSVVGAMVTGIRLDGLTRAATGRVDAPTAIYDAAGRRVAASAGGFAGRLPKQAKPGGPPFRERVKRNGRSEAIAYTSIDEGGTHIGALAVSLPTAPAYAAVSGARTRLVLILFAVMAAVVGLGALVARSVLGRVNKLVEANRALGAGDLTVRAPEVGRDELGELSAGFNVMAEQLQASYADMERRVGDRTEELQLLYQDLVRGNEARSDLFAAISHEFRTPLFAILAHAELMADPALRPKGARWPVEFAETISDSAHILLRRVNDILELAKLQATDLDLEVAPFDLRTLVERIRSQVGALARQADLTFTVDVASDVDRVLADEQRVEQVLLNLLSNAVKYNRPQGRVELIARAHDDGVEILVVDSGAGIAPDVGDRVFEPFYQVKSDASPARWSSSGLGLAVAKRLVEAQNGTIGYTSVQGEGTTFSLVLPAG